MRTSDFSHAPRQARAGAVLVVEGAAGHPRAVRNLRRHIVGARGHVWHTAYRRAGGRSGVVACFDDLGDAQAFGERLDAGRCAFVALEAEASGYSNGVWRAEAPVMAHIERYTPTSVEVERGTTPPEVAGATARDAAPDRSRRRTAREAAPGTSRRQTAREAAPGKSRRRTARKAAPGRKRAPARTSRAERPATDARAMFIGATKYRGIRSWLVLSRTWYPMVARMRTLPGYVFHTIYWEAPFTLGTVALFDSRDALLGFARLPAHRQLMQWITEGTRNGTGGYIRLLGAPGDDTADTAAPTTPGARPPS